MCNFEKSNMSRIESGRISPSLITLYKISKALNIEFYELFKFDK
ncbi:helix-turn-helix transcriptional regulator [Chryseobacterium gallinarum]|nr:helix-turn-helix transcriptional regulator [Chryseobacterium gallinarum]